VTTIDLAGFDDAPLGLVVFELFALHDLPQWD
jgi:hypothetical protein